MRKPTAVVIGVGAGLGLGAALCRKFAGEGYHVLVAGRTPGKVEAVVAAITAAGGSAAAVVMDATREEHVVRLFEQAAVPGAGMSPADLVVFNVGNNQRIDWQTLTAAPVRPPRFGRIPSAARRTTASTRGRLP